MWACTLTGSLRVGHTSFTFTPILASFAIHFLYMYMYCGTRTGSTVCSCPGDQYSSFEYNHFLKPTRSSISYLLLLLLVSSSIVISLLRLLVSSRSRMLSLHLVQQLPEHVSSSTWSSNHSRSTCPLLLDGTQDSMIKVSITSMIYNSNATKLHPWSNHYLYYMQRNKLPRQHLRSNLVLFYYTIKIQISPLLTTWNCSHPRPSDPASSSTGWLAASLKAFATCRVIFWVFRFVWFTTLQEHCSEPRKEVRICISCSRHFSTSLRHTSNKLSSSIIVHSLLMCLPGN